MKHDRAGHNVKIDVARPRGGRHRQQSSRGELAFWCRRCRAFVLAADEDKPCEGEVDTFSAVDM